MANAGTDQSVTEGDTVTLDGSSSSDPDETTPTYSWALTTGDGTGVTLSSATAAQPTFTAPDRAVGYTLVFTLTVSDGP